MKPTAFEYFTPSTVEEALQLLKREGDGAKILAGGQSLVAMMIFRAARPTALIDVNKIKELDYIREEGNDIVIGALTRERTIEVSPLIKEKCPILAKAITHIGHLPIRFRGTVGGSLVHADPTAEIPVASVALGAKMKIAGLSGERVVDAGEFFLTYLTSVLEECEMLVEVRIPTFSQKTTAWSYVDISRRHGDFAIVAVASILAMDKGGVCREARIALGGVAPTPIRVKDAEAVLTGEKLTDKLIEEAAIRASESEDVNPDSDYHATAEYRKAMAKVLIQRGLKEAWTNFEGRN
jgi:CO/xanthine dehydrogenase FAD-binding subunit